MKFILTFTIFLFLCVGQVFAGSSCDPKSNPKVLVQAMESASKLNRVLDELHPKVALIGRVGSDVSKYGLHYTHVGFVVHDYSARNGKWTVIHLLNQCGTANSSIYAQGLVNFFMDDLYNMDFEVAIPTKDAQDKILKLLHSKSALRLHDTHYNMLAYPFGTQYQNSNQWVLEVIASALQGGESRQAVQENLKKSGFKPSIIKISSLSRFGASLFKANVSFDDHPLNEKNNNQFSIVSVDSVIHYLNNNNYLALYKEVKN